MGRGPVQGLSEPGWRVQAPRRVEGSAGVDAPFLMREMMMRLGCETILSHYPNGGWTQGPCHLWNGLRARFKKKQRSMGQFPRVHGCMGRTQPALLQIALLRPRNCPATISRREIVISMVWGEHPHRHVSGMWLPSRVHPMTVRIRATWRSRHGALAKRHIWWFCPLNQLQPALTKHLRGLS